MGGFKAKAAVKTKEDFMCTSDEFTKKKVIHNYELAQKEYEKGEGFKAFVILAENGRADCPNRPFYDPAVTKDGRPLVNVGFGYCVSLRDKATVIRDLTAAGLSRENATKLANPNTPMSELRKIHISEDVSLNLLDQVKGQYVERAKIWAGEELWEKLPQHKRDAITYLGYNAAIFRNDGRRSFNKLHEALERGDDLAAIKHAQVTYSMKDKETGEIKRVVNTRFTGFFTDTFLSEATAKARIFEIDERELKTASAGKNGHAGVIKDSLALLKEKEPEIHAALHVKEPVIVAHKPERPHKRHEETQGMASVTVAPLEALKLPMEPPKPKVNTGMNWPFG